MLLRRRWHSVVLRDSLMIRMMLIAEMSMLVTRLNEDIAKCDVCRRRDRRREKLESEDSAKVISRE